MSKDRDEEETPAFRVHDRRRVQANGGEGESPAEPKPDGGGPGERPAPSEAPGREAASEAPSETPSAGPSHADMESARAAADAAATGHRHAPEVDFTTFVISLASSAMVHLGEVPHPDRGVPDTNLPMAKQTIDMLSMLKEKTRGNLEADEARYLDAILYDLRMRFVEATRAGGGEAGRRS
jgi:hypothetical protein